MRPFFKVRLIRFYLCVYLLCECPDNITFDDLGCLCWDHDGGHGDTGITMTSAALTSARSSDSGSGSGNCCCPIKLSSPRTSCGCWSLLGCVGRECHICEDSRWGLVPGTRHSHILRHQTRGAKTGSFSDCQVDRYLYLHLQELGQRHSPDAICCWVRRGDCRLVGGGRCSVTCYTHVLDATWLRCESYSSNIFWQMHHYWVWLQIIRKLFTTVLWWY